MNDSKPRGFGDTMLAVAWSFIGLRRRSDFERDVGALRPAYVIAGGLMAAPAWVPPLSSVNEMLTTLTLVLGVALGVARLWLLVMRRLDKREP